MIENISNNFYARDLLSAEIKKNNTPTEIEEDEFFSYSNKTHIIHQDSNDNNFIKVFKYGNEYYDAYYNSKTKESFIRFFRYKGQNHNVFYDKVKKQFYILISKPELLRSYDISLKEPGQNSVLLDGREYPILYDENNRPYIPLCTFTTLTPHYIVKEEKLRIKEHILSKEEKKQIEIIPTK